MQTLSAIRPARRSPESPLGELLRLHRPRLLMVEDDRSLEPLVRRAARSLDPPVLVDWCDSAESARELLARRFYDVVLADYLLDGDDAGLALRGDCWELQPQAVFAMTSSYALEDYLHSVGRPGSPFLPKPFGLWECRRFLASLLRPGRGRP